MRPVVDPSGSESSLHAPEIRLATLPPFSEAAATRQTYWWLSVKHGPRGNQTHRIQNDSSLSRLSVKTCERTKQSVGQLACSTKNTAARRRREDDWGVTPTHLGLQGHIRSTACLAEGVLYFSFILDNLQVKFIQIVTWMYDQVMTFLDACFYCFTDKIDCLSFFLNNSSYLLSMDNVPHSHRQWLTISKLVSSQFDSYSTKSQQKWSQASNVHLW